MFLTAALLMMSFPQAVPMALSDSKSFSSTTESARIEMAKEDAAGALPAAPSPKIAPDSASGAAGESSSLNAAPILAAEPIKPANPPKFAVRRSEETPRQRMEWVGLALAGHGAAAFDAYSTRQAISGGFGTEQNPLLRPFAHSGALYVATQVSPTVMDFLGHKMMRSRSPLLRKMWWLPQAAGAGISFSAGMHNMSLVK
ncbi:MAG TPA: hypothetical protein VKT53_05355 [Candidatus Acidoferrum sp.]|nr:hypothetical protein [Candidatus Acidoferrum sp.]